jgi:thiamine-monophosphate kinase
MRIDQLGEFGLIDRIQRALPASGPGVLVGIGDDVAVLEAGCDRVWLATCDIQVEGSHFLRERITPQDLGHRALAVNLSDIAATGGKPRYALISLGLPQDLPVEFIDGLYQGLSAEASQYGVNLVGGNISRSRLGMFIDIFLLGEAAREDILLRSGARSGDKILVTGTVGDAAAGVALLLDDNLKTTKSYANIARMRRDTPTPRVHEGQWIGAVHKATAMIDVSDGLAGDLGHICDKSGTGVRLYADQLPVSEANRALAATVHNDEWYFALHGGEDYELLFTVPEAQAQDLCTKVTAETGTPVSIIGEITPKEAGQHLVLPDGRVVSLEVQGWDHFKEEK